MNINEVANQLFVLEVNRSSAAQTLIKKFGKNMIDEINDALDEIYGEVDREKCDWALRVERLRQLVAENKWTQKQMAEIVVREGLFGGMASAKQCMPYIKMAQEWARQENYIA